MIRNNNQVISYLLFVRSFASNQKLYIYKIYINDPSAGSPTETLLRLLLPLNHQVRSTLARHM